MIYTGNVYLTFLCLYTHKYVIAIQRAMAVLEQTYTCDAVPTKENYFNKTAVLF